MALPLKAISVTAATVTLDRNVHRDAVVLLNRAAGVTVTLPAATGSGDVYKVFVGTTVTSNNHIVQVANANDILAGVVGLTTDIAGSSMPTSATTDTITMNGSTTGGLKGSWMRFEDVVSAGVWMLDGGIICTGTEATPFSAAV